MKFENPFIKKNNNEESLIDNKEGGKKEVVAKKIDGDKKVTASKITLENIQQALEKREPIEVKVRRSSGKLEDGWIAIRTYDNNVLVIKRVEGEEPISKVLSLEELQEMNEGDQINNTMEKDISETESFDDLIKIIEIHGGIQGTKQFYSPEDFEEIIDDVRNGEVELSFVTRAHGLRKKVEELLEAEKKDK